MRHLLIFFVLLLVVMLCGCAHDFDQPAERVQTVEVVREVQKPCPAERPARPARVGVLPSDLAALTAVLAAKLAEYSDPGKYADRAEAIFNRCITQ